MKTQKDEAVAEVRAARKALCDRFGNNPRRLLAYLREQQRQFQGRVIKAWPQIEAASVLREEPPSKRKGGERH